MERTDADGGHGSSGPNPEDLLTRKEAAALINYSVSTIRRWDRVGILTQLRTPTGLVRYRMADVLAAGEYMQTFVVQDDGTAA